MNKQHSFVVQVPPNTTTTDGKTTTPKAIVVLFGWWGASTKHVAKYARLYESNNCQTVQVILDKYALMLSDVDAMEDCAQRTISTIAKVLRGYEDDPNDGKKPIPVIFHAFSNGGAYVLERIEHFVRIEQERQKDSSYGSTNTSDAILVGKHLQGEIFDSSPAFPSEISFIRAMEHIFTNPLSKFILSQLTWFVFALHRLWCTLRGVPQYRWVFWENMHHSTLCTSQAFIYSPADTITDVEKLEALIDTRRKKNSRTEVQCFADSPHVAHLRRYPQDYQSFVMQFLERTVQEM
eukprot:scaffold4910_cov169-Amphora_coffeaeformis.AAC.16